MEKICKGCNDKRSTQVKKAQRGEGGKIIKEGDGKECRREKEENKI